MKPSHLFLIIASMCLAGCAGSGEGGAWTPADTAASVGAVNSALTTYDRYNHPEYYRPVAPVVVPTYPNY